MNRIYRKVWNSALGQVVVASELAKNSVSVAGCTGGSRAVPFRLGALVLALTLGLYGGEALAAQTYVGGIFSSVGYGSGGGPGSTTMSCNDVNYTTYNNTGANTNTGGFTQDGVAGANTSLNYYGSNTICGSSDAATQTNRILAYANNPTSNATNMTIGGTLYVNTSAVLQNATVNNLTVTGAFAIPYFIANSTKATGTATGTNAIGIGMGTTSAGATDSIAMGDGATVATTATSGIAMGSTAAVTGINGIAIGNGAQAVGTSTISVGTGNVISGNLSGAFGDPNTIAGNSSYAVGDNNTIPGNNSFALGNGNTINGNNSYALGSNNTIATGQTDVFALGNNITSTISNSVALGSKSVASGAAAYTTGTTSVTQTTINGVSKANAGSGTLAGVVSVGANGAERVVQNVGAGLISATSTDAINGSQAYNIVQAVQTPMSFAGNSGTAVTRTLNQTLAVKGGTSSFDTAGATGFSGANLNTITDPTNGALQLQISNAPKFGNITINAGNGGTITGLANGVNATDAVNLGQLQGSMKYFQASSSGTGASATGTDAVAVGPSAQSSNSQSIAIGTSSVSSGTQSVAVGSNTTSSNASTVAIGNYATATASGDTIIGWDAGYSSTSTGNNTVVGNQAGRSSSGSNNTALGYGAGATVTGSGNVAIGSNAGDNITASNTVSMGSGATASANNAVAIGNGAAASGSAANVALGSGSVANGSTLSNAAYLVGGTATAELNVGSRRITGVSAGSAGTDAVNVNQLTFEDTKVNQLGATASSTLGGSTAYNTTTGALSGTSFGLANANTIDGTSGAANNVTSAFSTVDAALGKLNTAVANGGTVQRTATSNQLALVASGGTGAAPGAAQNLTNVAVGVNPTDAVNMSQLTTTNTNVATNAANLSTLGSTAAAALGGTTTYNAATGLTGTSFALTKANSIAGTTGPATNVTSAFSTVDSALGTLNTSITNISNGTVGPVQQTGTSNKLALVASGGTGAAPGVAQNLTNVADGAVNATSTDAVNGSQLNTTNTNVTTNATNIAANTASITTNTTDIATNAANLSNLGSTTATALGGGTSYDATTGTLSGTSYTVQGSTYNNVGSALGGLDTAVTNNTTSISNITNQINNGSVGLVQQAAAGADLTVGKDTDGAAVNFADVNGNTRTLSNVTAGVNDTDAVNVSQLNTTNTNVATNATNIAANTANITTNTANIATNASNLSNLGSTTATALGGGTSYDATTGTLSGTSYGVQGSTYNNVGSALGGLDTAVTNNTTAIAGNTTSINNISNQINNGAIGPVQATGTANQLALVAPGGTGAAPGAAQNLTNVADGAVNATSTDAVNGSQLNTTNTNVATNATNIAANTASITTNTANIASNAANLGTLGSTAATALGGGTSYDATTGLSGTSYTVQGSTYNNVGSALGGLDNAVTGNTTSISNITNQINNGAIGPVQQTGTTNQLALVASGGTGAAPGAAQNLTNVADGAVNATSTDAVNGSQLNTTNTNVATNATNIAANTASIATNTTDIATNVTNLGNLGNTTAVALGGSTTYTPATGLSGTSFGLTNANAINGTTGAATDVTSGFSKVDSALGTINGSVTNISNQINNGTVGLVQQASAGANLTVGKDTDGTVVDMTGTAGTRTVTGVTAGTLSSASTDAVNGSQLYATNANVSTNATNIATNATNLGNLGNTMAVALGGSTIYTPATGLSGTSFGLTNANAIDGTTGAATDVTSGFSKVDSALGTINSSVTNISNQINSGTVGLVQQAAAGANLTVGKDTDGEVVDVTGTAGTRKITGVTDGDISASSSDVVNGSQLYATNQQVASNTSDISNLQVAISNSGAFQVSADRSGTKPVAMGTNSAAGGANAAASGANSVSVGNDSVASGTNASVLGQGATASAAGSTAIGQGAQATNANDVALGSGSVTSQAVAVSGATINGIAYSNFAGSNPTGAVSVGSAGNERQIQNVAAGQVTATSTDAVNGSQLYSVANQITSTGSQVTVNTTNITNLQTGSSGMFQVSADANGTAPVASGTQSTAGGNGAVASGTSSTAVGNNAQATGNNSVAIGAGSVATQANTVSVGSVGNERQIVNVAAGTQATDAVNVSQLQTSQAGTVRYDTNADGSVDSNDVTLNSGGSSASIHNVNAGTAVTDAVNVGQMNNGLQRVADWSKTYADNIGHQASAGVASAMAMANMPVAYAPNQSSVGMGVGSFRGQSSIALGMSTISPSGRYVFKATASTDSRGDTGVGLGAAITF